jgi:NAD(P)H-hydrate epimerase
VLRIAKKYNCVILLKSVDDIISDGKRAYTIKGGNAGLAKGGSGDVLAGLSCSFYAKNNVLLSALTSSILLKITAEKLFLTKGYWYNISDIIDKFPEILKSLRLYK